MPNKCFQRKDFAAYATELPDENKNRNVIMDNDQVQKKLSIVKKKVLMYPGRFEFSSYLEFSCRAKIVDFSSKEIDQAASKLIPILEKIVEQGNPARDLRAGLSFPGYQLNLGEMILGFCYVSRNFLEDLCELPKEIYWAIWFCIELLEYSSSTNTIFLIDSFTTKSELEQQLFRVPTGHIISYIIRPVTYQGRNINIVELMGVKEEPVQHE